MIKLGMKRITPATNKCYQATRDVVKKVANELIRMFMYEMASAFPEYEDDKDDSAEFMFDFTSEFISFLEEVAEGEDEWRRACSLFVFMVFDFEEFVNAYEGEKMVS